jgi:hypothetical protein
MACHLSQQATMKNWTPVNIPAATFSVVSVLSLLFAMPAFARKTNDVIVMKNGDRFTCEIKELSAGVLSVSLDYVDGTISVQWSKVARVESVQKFIVKTQDGSVRSGTLISTEAAPSQPMRIEIGEGQTVAVVDATQIVKITQTSERFWQRFNGAVDFGINYSKGNEATQFSCGAETEYIREQWGAKGEFNSNLSANSGSATSTRQQLTFSAYHLLPWNNYFYEGLGSFLQSSVQGISLQTSLGAGIGRFIKNTNRTTITLVGGLAWQNTGYQPSLVPTGTPNVTAALVAGELKVFKFKRTNLSLTAEVFPALSQPGRVRYGTNASYYLKLFSNLSWNVSFYGSWDNRPPAGFSGSDYGSSSGLRWTFGNE